MSEVQCHGMWRINRSSKGFYLPGIFGFSEHERGILELIVLFIHFFRTHKLPILVLDWSWTHQVPPPKSAPGRRRDKEYRRSVHLPEANLPSCKAAYVTEKTRHQIQPVSIDCSSYHRYCNMCSSLRKTKIFDTLPRAAGNDIRYWRCFETTHNWRLILLLTTDCGCLGFSTLCKIQGYNKLNIKHYI